MKHFNKLFFAISIVLFLTSCVKEETIYVQEENKAWVNFNSENDEFAMIDNENTNQNYALTESYVNYNENKKSFASFTTKRSYSEVYHNTFTPENAFDKISIILEAPNQHRENDILEIAFNRVSFRYDLKDKLLISVFVYRRISCELPCVIDDTLYNIDLLEKIDINGKEYKDVLFFKLSDFGNWDYGTQTEIYIAKNIGLIKYKLANGTTYERNIN